MREEWEFIIYILVVIAIFTAGVGVIFKAIT